MALALYYLYNSFYNPLPWSVCDPEWAPGGVCSDNSILGNSTNLNDSIVMQNKTWSELFWE